MEVKEWIYVIIYLQGKIFRQFSVLILTSFISYCDHSVGGEGIGMKGVDEEYIVILAGFDCCFIRVHENLVQHSSNNVSIGSIKLE